MLAFTDLHKGGSAVIILHYLFRFHKVGSVSFWVDPWNKRVHSNETSSSTQIRELAAAFPTSDVVAHAGSEAAPPGDKDPFEYLAIDAAWIHYNNWRAELRLDTQHKDLHTHVYNGVHSGVNGSFVRFGNEGYSHGWQERWICGAEKQKGQKSTQIIHSTSHQVYKVGKLIHDM